jgi:Xaa-Pro aminopeptidase
VHSDLWGAVDGYIFDFSRSAIVGGNGTKERRELMEIAAATVEVALEEVKLGMKIHEWVSRIEKRLDKTGNLKFSMTGVPAGFYGHGMGLAMEAPWIMPGDNTELAEGMYLAVERTMSVEGIGCAMYEENVILNKDGFFGLVRFDHPL